MIAVAILFLYLKDMKRIAIAAMIAILVGTIIGQQTEEPFIP